MKKALFLLLTVFVVHFLSNSLGLYDYQIQNGNVWIDNLLHGLVGFACALFFIEMLENKFHSKLFFFLTSIFFVILVSLAWELVELAFFKFFPSYALSLKIYSPSIQEALVDISSNIAGGLFFILWKFSR